MESPRTKALISNLLRYSTPLLPFPSTKTTYSSLCTQPKPALHNSSTWKQFRQISELDTNERFKKSLSTAQSTSLLSLMGAYRP